MKKNVYNLFLLLLLLLLQPNKSNAEGTATISPNATATTALAVQPSIVSGNYLNCSEDNRIYFRIKDFTTENFYFGFDWRNYGGIANPAVLTDMYYKIYDPTGAVVVGPSLFSAIGNGHINSWAEAIAGPNIAGSTPTGYAPLNYIPSMNGEYWIECYRSSDGGATMLVGTTWSHANYFDMTIATSTGTRYNGRIHCDKWGFVAIDPVSLFPKATASAEPVLYSYSNDKVVMKLDFEAGFRPIAFSVAVNYYGGKSTGNFATDRNSYNSAVTPTLANGFHIFVNKPDSTIYPYSTIPSQPTYITPMLLGCLPPYKIRYSLPDSGDVKLLLDINGTAGYQAGTADRIIEQFAKPLGLNTYFWDGLDGLGNNVTAGTQFNLSVVYLKGRFNVPIYDAELNINGFKISTIAPIINLSNKLFWNDALLTNVGATCSASTDNANNLTGAGLDNTLVGQIIPAHAWNGDGNLLMAIPAPSISGNDVDNFQCNDFGNVRVINSWGWGLDSKDTFVIDFLCINLSGTLWYDANKSAAGTNNNIYTAGEVGTKSDTTLFATLIDPVTGFVIASVPINADGTYTFSNVPTNGANMPVRITNIQGVVDAIPPPIATLPTNWKNTSPLQQLVTTTNVNLFNKDFGVNKFSPDTIITIPPSCPTCTITVCSIINDVDTTGGATYTTCGVPTGYTLVSGPTTDGCYTYQALGTVVDTQHTCIVTCANSKCDTTYIIIPPPIKPDTIITIPPSCPTCTITVCSIINDVDTTGGATYTTCGVPTGYTLVSGPTTDGCYTYQALGTVVDTQHTCIVTCANGKCDTTYIIIPPPIKPDTIITIPPSCPTCTITVCPIINDVDTTGGATYTTCSVPTGYTLVSGPTTDGCYSYQALGTVVDTQHTCIVTCANGKCDTTYIIIPPPIEPDTIIISETCDTCKTSLICATADNLPTNTGTITYSSCSTSPIGFGSFSIVDENGCYTFTGNGTQKITDTVNSCIVACKLGVCDTTYVKIYPPTLSLPLVLDLFSVSSNQCIVYLNWSTLEEIELSQYEIQRSKNSEKYKTIGIVKAVGNSTKRNEYSFTDDKTENTNYTYRLKMIDIDNSYRFSPERSINLNCVKQEIIAYPNPVEDILNLLINSVQNNNNYSIQIRDIVGNIVFSKTIETIENKTIIPISTQHFTKGLYSINIINEDGVQTISKFLKK